MSFSASPLVPDTGAGDDSWRRTAERVLEAVTQAAAQIPSAAPLEPQAPVPDGSGLTLPAGTAVTAYLGGGAEGKVLLVVGTELVEALAGTPFGAVEPAAALRPALETLAGALGGRLDGAPTGTPSTAASTCSPAARPSWCRWPPAVRCTRWSG